MIKEIICISRFLMDALWYVPKFALAMRLKIWKNRHKYITGHWKEDSAWRWLALTQDEVRELRKAMEYEANMIHPTLLEEAKQKRKWEAVDVANFAMMAAYADEID